MTDIAKNELYYFFVSDTLKLSDIDTLKLFPPLEFDPSLIPSFLSEETLYKVKWDMIDMMEECYHDLYENNINKIAERKIFMRSFTNYISTIL